MVDIEDSAGCGARRGTVALIVAAALTCSSCGSSTPTLDTASVERAIESSIRAQRHLRTTVVCPAKVDRKRGVEFTCAAHLDVGIYPVAVTVTNASGRVRYENHAPLVALDVGKVQRAIARSIADQRHLLGTRVTCPAEVIQMAGVVFRCTATIDGQGHPFRVTEVDSSGHVSYVGER